MPLFYLPPIQRRLRHAASLKGDSMAGALATSEIAHGLGITWRVVGQTRGFAAVYGIQLFEGEWPQEMRPTLRLRGREIVDQKRKTANAPPALLEALRNLDVESWEAVTDPQPAFRFRPYGAMFVTGIIPPSRYTRGLSEKDAAAAVAIWKASCRFLGIPLKKQARPQTVPPSP